MLQAEREPEAVTVAESAEQAVVVRAAEGLSMEAILERLSKVVDSLERGDMALEESLRMFEEGVKLTREGQRRLDSAEKRIEMLLLPDVPGGEASLQPMPVGQAPRS